MKLADRSRSCADDDNNNIHIYSGVMLFLFGCSTAERYFTITSRTAD